MSANSPSFGRYHDAPLGVNGALPFSNWTRGKHTEHGNGATSPSEHTPSTDIASSQGVLDSGGDETGASAEKRAFYAGLDSIVRMEVVLLRRDLERLRIRHLDSSPKEATRNGLEDMGV